jgi:hypothetical protein
MSINVDFNTISQLALDSKFAESAADKLSAAKKISTVAAGIVQELKNGPIVMSEQEEDMRWLVGQLAQRNVDGCFVWVKSDPDWISGGGLRTKVWWDRHKALADARHDAFPLETSRVMDRRMAILLSIEDVLNLTPRKRNG